MLHPTRHDEGLGKNGNKGIFKEMLHHLKRNREGNRDAENFTNKDNTCITNAMKGNNKTEIHLHMQILVGMQNAQKKGKTNLRRI